MEEWAEQIKLVGGDVKTIGISAYVRIIAQTWSVNKRWGSIANAPMVRRSLRAVVLRRDLVHNPGSSGIRRGADGDVQMVATGQRLRSGNGAIQRQHYVEPALRVGIEIATGVGDRGPKAKRAHLAVDGRRVSVESIEVDR